MLLLLNRYALLNPLFSFKWDGVFFQCTLATAPSKKRGSNKHSARSSRAFSWIATAFPRWRCRMWPCLRTSVPTSSRWGSSFGLLVLLAFPPQPLPFLTAMLPSLSALPRTAPYCGPTACGGQPGNAPRRRLLPRSALSKVWLARGLGAAGKSLPAGARGELLVQEWGSPFAGEGLQRRWLPRQHCSMGPHLQYKPLGGWVAVTNACCRKIHAQGKGEGFPAG